MSGPLQKNIPQPNDLISKSQGDLLNNSQYWVDSLSKDHQIVNGHLSSQSFEGRHLQVSLFPQAATTQTPTDGADSVIFSSGGLLYWRNTTMTGPAQLTNNFVPTVATNGSTFLPGGLIFNWGNQNDTSPLLVNFTTPYTNLPYSVTMTYEGTTGSGSVSGVLYVIKFNKVAGQWVSFNYGSTSSNITNRLVSWMAIGT